MRKKKSRGKLGWVEGGNGVPRHLGWDKFRSRKFAKGSRNSDIRVIDPVTGEVKETIKAPRLKRR